MKHFSTMNPRGRLFRVVETRLLSLSVISGIWTMGIMNGKSRLKMLSVECILLMRYNLCLHSCFSLPNIICFYSTIFCRKPVKKVYIFFNR
ncbi:unnamed protein product [Protopolystoma xenopodis]|uniref:Uncharacterized protein n=1 Tax=Protopolystoma xenopodis TaxID=117903 RepID=A0A448WZM9_9PLAT|nr:unnamed protein product [Protopolystoma xenopodis]